MTKSAWADTQASNDKTSDKKVFLFIIPKSVNG